MAGQAAVGDGNSALALSWAFGFNKDIPGGVHNLSDDTRSAIFYVAAHSGVVYDFINRKQLLLQGHCNPITCCCVSGDKRWIATADAGPESMIVVWDSLSGTPIKTMFQPHPHGVAAMDMSPDAMFLVTLGAPPPSPGDEEGGAGAGGSEYDEGKMGGGDGGGDGEPQQLALWEWTVEREGPLYVSEVPGRESHCYVRFNSTDVREIVSNGLKEVTFWSWEDKTLSYYSPPLSKRDFKLTMGAFTGSLFIPGTAQAITTSAEGNVVVWDQSLVGQAGSEGGEAGAEGEGGANVKRSDRRAVKVVSLCKGGIHFVTVVNEYLAVCGQDGSVRFFDFQFRVAAWFEDMQAGPITSISFSNAAPQRVPQDPDAFRCADFIVGSKQGYIVGMEAMHFQEVQAVRRRGTLLVQGFDGAVHGLAAHPKCPQIAVTCNSGALQLWDYEEKRLLNVRIMDTTQLRPQCLAYDPAGKFLAVGCTNGILQVLWPDTKRLQDAPRAQFRHAEDAITDIRFSHDSLFMATADTNRCVAIYRFVEDGGSGGGAEQPEVDGPDGAEGGGGARDEWVYIGRYQSHTKAITGLEFKRGKDGERLLVSVGEDKRLVEYDLDESSVVKGVQLKGRVALTEQTAVPTTCMWLPQGKGSREDQLVTASDEYKLKLWNAANKTCRRTALAPTFGGPVNRMVPLRTPGSAAAGGDDADTEYMLYSTASKVIGLLGLPLDGNPHRTMGLVAHPRAISGIASSYDGRFVVSSGGDDMTVNLWTVQTAVIERNVAEGGKGADPFVDLIDGGREGEFYQDLVEYFYYAQLRSQGETANMADTEMSGQVPVAEIPNLMRALGCYPTEKDIENMCSEVKYSQFTDTGETVDSIDLDAFVRLYVNHRPVFGIGRTQIAEAFRILGLGEGKGGEELAAEDVTLETKRLFQMLERGGESISSQELTTCLKSLMGPQGAGDMPGSMDAGWFAENVLGFEEDEEEGYDEGEYRE